jgi:hypothetical protein
MSLRAALFALSFLPKDILVSFDSFLFGFSLPQIMVGAQN